MKRLNIDLDDELVQKAMKMSGIKTKKELINTALKHYRDRLLMEIEANKKQNYL